MSTSIAMPVTMAIRIESRSTLSNKPVGPVVLLADEVLLVEAAQSSAYHSVNRGSARQLHTKFESQNLRTIKRVWSAWKELVCANGCVRVCARCGRRNASTHAKFGWRTKE